MANLYGTNGDDVLLADSTNDQVYGLAGNDTYVVINSAAKIYEAAGEGYDTIYSTVSYTLTAGQEIERLFTWDAAATDAINLTGNAFVQILAGNAGANTLDGGGGADILVGRGGDDTYIIGDAAAHVIENAGEGLDTVYAKVNYSLEAGASVERLYAWDALATTALTLIGNNLVQTIAGNAGANVLYGGGGADTLTGRGGDDVYIIDDASAHVVEVTGEGYDTVYAIVNYTLEAGQYVERLFAYDAAVTTALDLTGNELAQVIAGTAGANVLTGGGGADALVGRGGDDTYVITTAAAHVIENAGEGFDTVRTTVSYTLDPGQSVEALTAFNTASTTALILSGNDLAQSITGNAGANVLFGGGGADTLYGLGGDDEYVISDAAARVYENAGQGNDTVYTQVSYALQAGQSIERLFAYDAASTTALSLTGNELAQTIAGNAAANHFYGGGGADSLVGHAGDDVYHVDNAEVNIYEVANEGMDTVIATVSYVLTAGQNIERLVTGGTGNINLTGNEFTQYIGGNDGNNVLDSGGGLLGHTDIDILEGGRGDDTYIVRSGRPVIRELSDYTGGFDTMLVTDKYALQAGLSIEAMRAFDPASTVGVNMTGNELVQIMTGSAGADTLGTATYGGASLSGLGGNDSYNIFDTSASVTEGVGGGYDAIYLNTANYTLAAGQEIEELTIYYNGVFTIPHNTPHTMIGNEFGQIIISDGGNDFLNGRGGADTLTGRGGADIFAFDTALGGGNVDHITDFRAFSDTDQIWLDDAIFSGMAVSPTGILQASAFVTGAAAADADDRIIFNPATRELFYDADGSGAGAAVLFATIGTSVAVQASDFVVF